MTPVTSRNVANAIIVVGLLPVLLWLGCLALTVLSPRDPLPWVSAGIILFGAPLGMLSFFVTAPVMMYAHNRASQNRAVWTRVHRVPFFFGFVTFSIAVVTGLVLVVVNSHR
jgi:hypothetical protein